MLRHARAAVAQIQADLRAFRDQYRLDQVVVINVASTEPPFEVSDSQPLKEFVTLLGSPPTLVVPAARFTLGRRSTSVCRTSTSRRRGRLLPGCDGIGPRTQAGVAGKDGKNRRNPSQDRAGPDVRSSQHANPGVGGHNILATATDWSSMTPATRNRRSAPRIRSSHPSSATSRRRTCRSSTSNRSMTGRRPGIIHFRGFLNENEHAVHLARLRLILASAFGADCPAGGATAQRQGKRACAPPGVLLQESDGRGRARFFRQWRLLEYVGTMTSREP